LSKFHTSLLNVNMIVFIKHNEASDIASCKCARFMLSMQKKTLWPVVCKQTIPTDRRLSAKLVPTFADRGGHVVSTMEPHSH
jgi:hypothetical protein